MDSMNSLEEVPGFPEFCKVSESREKQKEGERLIK